MDFNRSEDKASKKRIRVACDNCRRKKIKCDGQYPCGNCQQSNGSGCHYKERQEKRVKPSSIPKRVSNAKTIEILDTRLSKLEDVILNLADRLESRSDGNQNNGHNSRSVKEDGRQNNDEESNDGDSTSIDYGDEYEAEEDEEEEEAGKDREVLKEKAGNQESESEEDRDKGKKWTYTPQLLEQFFGTHSVICLFSDKSLGWIESALGPEDSRLINPIRNLPFVFYMRMKSFILKWVDPPLIDATKKKKLLESPFPENYRLVFDFLENYYDAYTAANFICDIDWVKGLFEIYYGINGKKRRKFKCSELIIMSMVICLCISCKIDEDTSGLNMSPASSCSANTPKSIQSMNNDQLTVLQEELFDNCVFYYHRILVINDGIETIQAIILLIIYIESSWITSHVSYMLISVAIRFAQEIGLHRQESYANLSAQECETRKMIWWCCYCFDMEICFRSGKPPLINGLDISINSEKDFFFANAVGIESLSDNSNNEGLKYLDHKKRSKAQMQYYFLLLTRLRSKSYNSLFVASAQTESFENLLSTLDSLNMEILKLGESMESLMRPRLYNDPEFHNIYRQFEAPNMKDILVVNFIYFSHLMIINRIPFLIGIPDCDETCAKSLSFRNLFLDSARTILVIAKSMPRENIGLSFYNWLVFFPSAAFMSLLTACINHPTAPGTYDDVRLLIDSSMNFFSIKKSWPVEGFSRFKVYQSKEALVDLIIKILLKIVIRVFETNTGIQILATNELLREHLESTERQFPDIFKENRDFGSQFASVLNGSSFGTQGFIKIGGGSPFTSFKSFNTSPGSSSSHDSNTSYHRQNNRGTGRNESYEFSNNMSPNLSNSLNMNSSTNGNFINDELLSDYINDDGLSSLINSQMNNLPNFFFDNNLGI